MLQERSVKLATCSIEVEEVEVRVAIYIEEAGVEHADGAQTRPR